MPFIIVLVLLIISANIVIIALQKKAEFWLLNLPLLAFYLSLISWGAVALPSRCDAVYFIGLIVISAHFSIVPTVLIQIIMTAILQTKLKKPFMFKLLKDIFGFLNLFVMVMTIALLMQLVSLWFFLLIFPITVIQYFLMRAIYQYFGKKSYFEGIKTQLI